MNIYKSRFLTKKLNQGTQSDKIQNILLLAFIIANNNIVIAQENTKAQIKGKITNAVVNTIQIGDNSIPLSSAGEFFFSADKRIPNFFDIICGQMKWAVFLEPGKTVELTLTSGDWSSLEYKGDLKSSNDYLKKATSFNNEINDFFSKNWVRLHRQNETNYSSMIDSIKGLYLNPLSKLAETNGDVSRDFIRLYKADVHFGLNELILRYPERHFNFTGEKVELSGVALDYLNSMAVDDTGLVNLQSYNNFCKKWIDYHAEILIEQYSGQKHYDLKKMDVLPKVLSQLFKNRTVSDYWWSEYLVEHIQNTWLSNSETYIKNFMVTCKTESYNARIRDLYASCRDAEKDHVVKTVKTVNGYNLQAHLFYHDGIGSPGKRPAIVIFHGGGFVLGNPSWAFGQAKHYAGLGMVAVAAQYRLSNFKDVTPLDAIRDSKDLMIWLRENADSLGIIGNRIAASGWSVGGQLCLTLAIFPDTLQDDKTATVPNALLLTSPGVSTGGWFTELLNGAKIDPASLSPVDHVTQGLPPTIILQGRDDTVTPLKDVQSFYEKMAAKGNDCEIWIYDGVGHLFTPTRLGDQGWPRPDPEVQRQAGEKADAFLKKFGFIK